MEAAMVQVAAAMAQMDLGRSLLLETGMFSAGDLSYASSLRIELFQAGDKSYVSSRRLKLKLKPVD